MKLLQNRKLDTRMLSKAFADTLEELMLNDNRVCYLDADLMSCIGTVPLWKKYPDRIYNCGIAEANMVGVAAGMSATGKIPYIHSFGIFASRRIMDQAFMSVAYAKLNVKIIGSDPGVTAAYNGGTHMPFEDMAVMLSIPEATVLEPADFAQFVSVMKQVNDTHGLTYIRMPRKNQIQIFEDGSEFKLGKGLTLTQGNDLTIISSGIMLDEALKAADILKQDGINARVVNLFTWKPIDSDLITKCAIETGAIVTAENHNILCGLGSQVAKVVAQNAPVPMEFVGVRDIFGQVGPEDFLREYYKLTADEIVLASKKVLAKKTK